MTRNQVLGASVAIALGASLSACSKPGGELALSRHELEPIPDVPVPAADGPKLGAIAHTTPVRRRPALNAKIIGYLHAGAKVARAQHPYSTDGCPKGWFAIRPRGFVCLNQGATLDLRHPTLTTMAIQPNLAEPMPYTYARTRENADVFAVDEDRERAVRHQGKITSKSGMAIVGSWSASDAEGKERRLAMLSDGRFVDATQLERATSSDFQGVELGEEAELPLGFIVKRGVFAWQLSGPKLTRKDALPYQQQVRLTGRFRTVRTDKFWERDDGLWVRHRDMTTVRIRETFPEFVEANTRWLDVSVVMGSAVAYEGKRAVYVTLASVGKDRLGGELENPRITERGEFEVVSKHITALNAKPGGFANRVELYDTPWAIEVSSGQLLHAAYWHNRFGIEHGPGNVQLSPKDARWVWHWVSPELPDGWHAVTDTTTAPRTYVNIRK